MYISRVEVDTEDRTKIRDLTHVGAFHSWVEDSFPDEKNELRTRKLWRMDKLHGKDYLTIVSQSIPDKDRLERYGVKNTAATKDYEPFLKSIKDGDRMFFKVTLNPVISKSEGAGKRGRAVPCKDDKSRMEYFMERSEKNGFELNREEFTITEKGVFILKKAKSSNIKFVKAVYQGKLTVSDAEKFREMLSQGIGKHKAYGFGLMSVIPMVD